MKQYHRLGLIFLSLVFVLVLNFSSAEESDEQNYMDELLTEDEYPQDMDTLEEFIQSYYLLLDSNEYLNRFKFINQDKNVFQNDAKTLKPFYEKLLELRSGVRDRVSVYQIGDSHIQSGYFPGTARASLQKYYGNAGRGLIFPLRLAGTNQPDDYKISSAGGITRNSSDRGIGGFALNASATSSIDISTNSFFNTDNSFNKLSVISSSPGLSPKAQVADGSETFANWNEYSLRSLMWDKATSKISVKLDGEASILYGLILEKQSPGLLYHSTGINGAGFYNLLDSPNLFKQIGMLNPDLIIISLGTNDAQGKYRNDLFASNLKRFWQLLRTYCPDSAVLFTLPPDSKKHGKHNADLEKLEKTIVDFARQNSCAWWDLSDVMGGKGSISKWRKEQMASQDYLHYTPKGYMLQGYLFYQAFVKSYKYFSENAGIKER